MLGQKRSFSNNRIPGYRTRGRDYSRKTQNGDAWKNRLWIALAIFGVVLFIGMGRLWANVLRELPNINEIEEFEFKQATVITDKSGQVLYKLFEENRDYINYEDISQHFINATIATEDQRFWDNPGVDRKGTLRA